MTNKKTKTKNKSKINNKQYVEMHKQSNSVTKFAHN